VFIFVIFTHPVMQLLARTRFFGGGHKLSGLDPEALGAVYRSRSQYREVTTASVGRGAKNARSRGDADRRQTIAEASAPRPSRARDPPKPEVRETPDAFHE